MLSRGNLNDDSLKTKIKSTILKLPFGSGGYNADLWRCSLCCVRATRLTICSRLKNNIKSNKYDANFLLLKSMLKILPNDCAMKCNASYNVIYKDFGYNYVSLSLVCNLNLHIKLHFPLVWMANWYALIWPFFFFSNVPFTFYYLVVRRFVVCGFVVAALSPLIWCFYSLFIWIVVWFFYITSSFFWQKYNHKYTYKLSIYKSITAHESHKDSAVENLSQQISGSTLYQNWGDYASTTTGNLRYIICAKQRTSPYT